MRSRPPSGGEGPAGGDVPVPEDSGRFQRADPRASTRRAFARYQRRDRGERFWRSLSLVGAVGWPIVLLAAGGALLGRALDARWGGGRSATLVLLVAGTIAGALIAMRNVRGGGGRP